MATASEDDADISDEEEQRLRQVKMEEQWSRDDAWDGLQRECELNQQREEALRRKAIVYRAVYDFIYIMRPGDPSAGSIRRANCQPGAAFYSSGERWAGPQGGVWLERQGVSPDGRGVEQGWLLLHSPDTAEDKPWLIPEQDMADRARIQVKYLAESHTVRIFENCLPASSKVRAVKARICGETGLNIGSIVLLPRLGQGDVMRRGDLGENEDDLPDNSTLAEAGLRGEVLLYMLYTAN
eukprot:UN2660